MSSLFFLISWLSNAFFVFVTLAAVVQGILGLFQIKNYRLRAFARMIPTIALVFMPLLQKLNIGLFLNPLSCDGWLQKLIVYFFPGTKSYLSMPKETFKHYLSVEPFTSIVSVFVGLFVVVTGIKFFGKICQLSLTFVRLQRLIHKAKPCSREVHNPWLLSELKQLRIRVLVSDLIPIPMAIASRTILLSQTAIEQLKQDEFESVIGHELAHLRGKDPWSRLFHQLLKAFFWWVPMKRWLKKIEEDQEIACDQMVQMRPEAMASALVKMTKFARDQEKELTAAFCNLTKRSPFILVRLERILGIESIQEGRFWQGIVPLIAGPLILLSCTL